MVCGIERELSDAMTQSGLRERIGENNIFWADQKLHQSTELDAGAVILEQHFLVDELGDGSARGADEKDAIPGQRAHQRQQ